MNLNEGTRRLALLLGIVGMIAGGAHAYQQCQTVRHEREILDLTPAQWQMMSHVQRHDALYGMEEWQRAALAKDLGYYDWLDVDKAMNAACADSVLPHPPTPSSLAYFWAAVWPLVGFLVPWVAIRATVWVGKGFLKDSV